jgi:hypothetical protein
MAIRACLIWRAKCCRCWRVRSSDRGGDYSAGEAAAGLAQEQPCQSAAGQHSGHWADHRHGSCEDENFWIYRVKGKTTAVASEMRYDAVRISIMAVRGKTHLRETR